jgi:hypothetical protein
MFFLKKENQNSGVYLSNIGTKYAPILLTNLKFSLKYLPTNWTVSTSFIIACIGIAGAFGWLISLLLFLGLQESRMALESSVKLEIKKEYLSELRIKRDKNEFTKEELKQINFDIDLIHSEIVKDNEYILLNYSKRVKPFRQMYRNVKNKAEIEVKPDIYDYLGLPSIVIFNIALFLLLVTKRFKRLLEYPQDLFIKG